MTDLRKSTANKNAVATCEGQPPRQRFSSTAVYLALGMLADGTRDILGIWI